MNFSTVLRISTLQRNPNPQHRRSNSLAPQLSYVRYSTYECFYGAKEFYFSKEKQSLAPQLTYESLPKKLPAPTVLRISKTNNLQRFYNSLAPQLSYVNNTLRTCRLKEKKDKSFLPYLATLLRYSKNYKLHRNPNSQHRNYPT